MMRKGGFIDGLGGGKSSSIRRSRVLAASVLPAANEVCRAAESRECRAGPLAPSSNTVLARMRTNSSKSCSRCDLGLNWVRTRSSCSIGSDGILVQPSACAIWIGGPDLFGLVTRTKEQRLPLAFRKSGAIIVGAEVTKIALHLVFEFHGYLQIGVLPGPAHRSHDGPSAKTTRICQKQPRQSGDHCEVGTPRP